MSDKFEVNPKDMYDRWIQRVVVYCDSHPDDIEQIVLHKHWPLLAETMLSAAVGDAS